MPILPQWFGSSVTRVVIRPHKKKKENHFEDIPHSLLVSNGGIHVYSFWVHHCGTAPAPAGSSGPGGNIRVMSPTCPVLSTTPSPEDVGGVLVPFSSTPASGGIPSAANEGVLVGWDTLCCRCTHPVLDPVLCAQCGAVGHPVCLNLEYFQGYPFCGGCLGSVIQEYAAFQDALRREQWTRSLSGQIATWRSRAIEALGVSSTVGIAIGGVAMTATGAAVSLVKGVMTGAATTSGPTSAALQDAAAEVPLATGTQLLRPKSLAKPMTRSASAGSLPSISSSYKSCVACHTSNPGHKAHTYSGDCKGLPKSVYFAAKAKKQNPAAETPSSTKMPAAEPQAKVDEPMKSQVPPLATTTLEASPPQSYGSAVSVTPKDLITPSAEAPPSPISDEKFVVGSDTRNLEVQKSTTQLHINSRPESTSKPQEKKQPLRLLLWIRRYSPTS